MASTSEVGHAKNVANFQDLISFCTGYGPQYNPVKDSLKLPQLNALFTTAQEALIKVTHNNTQFNNTVNERMEAFADLRQLSTRLLSALQTTNAIPEKIEDAKGFNRKIQGKRASKPTKTLNPETPAPKTISSSQQSYDQLVQHFKSLISVLESEPSYTPNEAQLQIETIKQKATDLETANHKVADAYTNITNARIERDKTLYQENNGLVDTAKEVKQYIKSVFGAASQEYAQVSGIRFTIRKI